PREAVDGYQKAIELANAGIDSGRDNCIRMGQAILACLPPEAPALLTRLARGLSCRPLIELEIVINHRALENYPWELLAESGLLTAPDVDVSVSRGRRRPPPKTRATN